MKLVGKRLILLGVACVMLVMVTIFLTVAWYTRMVSTAGMEFEVAQWEFMANELVDDFYVNIYQYASLTENKAAPGTAGYVNLELNLGESETDIEYYITVDKTTMSNEFQDRIYFYYEEESSDEESADEESDESTKKLVLFQNQGDDLVGTITLEEPVKTITIYWQWLYEMPEYLDGLENTKSGGIYSAETWDAFDTLVGKNPELYEQYMMATIQVYAVQVEPDTTGDDNLGYPDIQ